MYNDRPRGGDRRGGGMRPSFAPVKVGEELDVKIEAVGEKGDGVAKVKGFVLFVPGVKEGQTVRIKVTRVLSKVGFAEVVGSAQPEEGSEASPAEEESSYEGEDTENFGDESSEESSETSPDEQEEEYKDEEEQ